MLVLADAIKASDDTKIFIGALAFLLALMLAAWIIGKAGRSR